MVRRPFDDVRQSLLPRPLRASPTDAEYLSDMLCPLPRRTESVHDGYRVGALPRLAIPDPYCLPRSCAGSASALQLSGPARTLHALRPARLLAHLSVDFSREVSISTVTSAHRSPAIESNHQLFEWVPPPLVFSPFGAHARSPAPQAFSANTRAPHTPERSPSAGGTISGMSM